MFLALILLGGCSYIMGGKNEEVIAAEQKARESKSETERIAEALKGMEAKFALGEVTEAEVEAARTAFSESLARTDAAMVDLNSKMDAVEDRYSKLPEIGGAVGSAFGPIGALIGTGLMSAIAAFLGWRGTKKPRSLVNAYQEGREVLAKDHPEALEALDGAMKSALPAPIKEWVGKLKAKGLLGRLAK